MSRANKLLWFGIVCIILSTMAGFARCVMGQLTIPKNQPFSGLGLLANIPNSNGSGTHSCLINGGITMRGLSSWFAEHHINMTVIIEKHPDALCNPAR